MTQFPLRNDKGPQVPLEAWVKQIEGLEVEYIEIDVKLTAPAEFGSPLNTVVRGMFGKNLREARCLTRARSCVSCPKMAACDYGRIFETPADVAVGAHGSHTAHPFWLQGIPAVLQLGRGRSFTARLCCIGPARAAIPYLDVALRMALSDAGSPGLRHVFELGASHRQVVKLGPFSQEAGLLKFEAKTPLILGKNDPRNERDCPAMPWLPQLMRAGVRRIASLSAAYGIGRLEASAVFPDLRSTRFVDGHLRPWHGDRWSARQGRRMPLFGVNITATIEGESVTHLRPLLQALQIMSVGKQTSMGLGELFVRSASAPRHSAAERQGAGANASVYEGSF